jgi:hypothetical protein
MTCRLQQLGDLWSAFFQQVGMWTVWVGGKAVSGLFTHHRMFLNEPRATLLELSLGSSIQKECKDVM